MSTLRRYLRHPLGSMLAKFELAAVISPVTVADKAAVAIKVTILTFDLTLT